MKYIFILIGFVLPISLAAQSLNENPYLTYYLGPNLQESSLGAITIRNYDGIAKVSLIKNIPSSWIGSYSLNHLPISDRYADYNTPFGRNYLGINYGTNKVTSIQFLGSHLGEIDGNIITKRNLDKKKNIHTGILLNYHYYNTKRDQNEDNFLDLYRKKKIIGINNWAFNKKNINSYLSVYHLRLNEIGGEVNFDKDEDYLTTNAYGLGNDLAHTGFAIKNDFKIKKEETNNGNLFLDADARFSKLTQYFGIKEYKGDERVINIYTGYHFIKNLTDYEIGLHYRNEKLEETYAESLMTNRNFSIPSIYGKIETKFGYRVKLLADIRANYHSNDNFLVHPSLKLSYIPIENMIVNIFTGNGSRHTNFFTEYNRFLFSSRELIIPEEIKPEKVWHYGFSFRYTPYKYFDMGNNSLGNFKYYFLFYHNIYQNTNIVNLNQDNQIIFQNHEGKAYKTSLNNRFSFTPFNRASLMMMHRFDIFKTDHSGELENRLYYPKHSFMLTFNYNLRWIKFNTQFHLVGKSSTTNEAYESGFSPKRKRWDMSVVIPLNQYFGGFDFFKKFDLIVGTDNVLGKKSDDIILQAENPFSAEMDGGVRNGSALGARFYTGLKIDF